LCCIFIEIEILLKQGPRTGPFDSRGSRGGGGPIYLVSVRMRGGLTRSTANAGLCGLALRGAGQPAYPPLLIKVPIVKLEVDPYSH